MKNNLEGDKVAELMKPRYKVIADYPDSKYKVDEIIELTWNDPLPNKYGGYQSFYNKYPHLFKKLQWWEERKEDEMPEYVKYKFMEDSKWKYFKVMKHFTNSAMEPNKYGFLVNRDDYNSYSKSLPITQSEYLNQQGK